MHTTPTEHRSSKPGRRPRSPSGPQRCTQPEPGAKPKIAEAATRIEEHDPMLLLAALEEIECRQQAIEALRASGLLGHCLE